MSPESTKTLPRAALVEALVAARERAQLTQREVIDRLPAWLGISQPDLAKIETGRRSVSYVEVRELCAVTGTTVARLDRRVSALIAAHRPAPRRKK